MGELADGRGILYPARLPSFHREPAPKELSDRIRWFWIPRWRLAPGRTSRQSLLPFPASNLVVAPDGVSLAGPTTGASHRDLRGTGWVVGALLRPAGLASLHADPHSIRNTEIAFDAPELHRMVPAAMDNEDEIVGRDRATRAYADWTLEHITAPKEAGLLANSAEDLIASDRTIVRVEQLAERLALSPRALQRLFRRHFGLPPLTVIRRYRLQDAAQRLRAEPSVTIADVAAELGYADHAHLSSDFRTALGFTPNSYRRDPGSAD